EVNAWTNCPVSTAVTAAWITCGTGAHVSASANTRTSTPALIASTAALLHIAERLSPTPVKIINPVFCQYSTHHSYADWRYLSPLSRQGMQIAIDRSSGRLTSSAGCT